MTRRKGARAPLSECRDCACPIRFAQLDTGSAIPLNPLPNPAGNVACRLVGVRLQGRVLGKSDVPLAGEARYMPHAATCEATKPRVPGQRQPDHDSLF